MNINIATKVEFTGVELTIKTNQLLDISISDSRSDIHIYTDINNNEQKVLIFSIENTPFISNELNIIINNGSKSDVVIKDVIVASRDGIKVPVVMDKVNAFEIENIYPNPFNPTTKIKYDVQNSGKMRISVYNILGQEVAELCNEYKDYGNHSVVWDASNMSSGVYYVRMELNGHAEANKVMLIK